jgi:predicted deacetylase
MEPTLVVLVHPVSPSRWPACERLLQAVQAVGPVTLTWLLSPEAMAWPRDPAFEAAIRQRLDAGDEVGLRAAAAPAGDRRWRRLAALEPARGRLRCEDALNGLQAALRWFSARGWPLHGVVPPPRGVGPGLQAALQLMPLRYAVLGRELQLLSMDEALALPSVGPRCGGAWPRLVARLRERLPGALGLDRAPVLRLDLRPEDADRAGPRRRWQRCLARQLALRRSATLANCAHDCGRLVRAAQADDGGLSAPEQAVPLVSAESPVLPDNAAPTPLPDDWVGPGATPRHAAGPSVLPP